VDFGRDPHELSFVMSGGLKKVQDVPKYQFVAIQVGIVILGRIIISPMFALPSPNV